MKRFLANWLPLLVIALLASMSLWLRLSTEEGVVRPSQGDGPDAIVENLRITRLTEDGSKHHMLVARRLEHFQKDDVSELTKPVFTREDENGSSLRANAERGRLSKDRDEMFFYGNVVMTRSAGKSEPEMRIQTEYLHVLTDKDIARSDKLVRISEGPSVLTGIGMEYEHKIKHLALHSQVKGSYAKRKR